MREPERLSISQKDIDRFFSAVKIVGQHRLVPVSISTAHLNVFGRRWRCKDCGIHVDSLEEDSYVKKYVEEKPCVTVEDWFYPENKKGDR